MKQKNPQDGWWVQGWRWWVVKFKGENYRRRLSEVVASERGWTRDRRDGGRWERVSKRENRGWERKKEWRRRVVEKGRRKKGKEWHRSGEDVWHSFLFILFFYSQMDHLSFVNAECVPHMGCIEGFATWGCSCITSFFFFK